MSSVRTFARRGKAPVSASPSTRKSAQGARDPFDLLAASPDACADPASPFFFGGDEEGLTSPAQPPGAPAAAVRKSPRTTGTSASSAASPLKQRKQPAAVGNKRSPCKPQPGSAAPVAATARAATRQPHTAVAAGTKANRRSPVRAAVPRNASAAPASSARRRQQASKGAVADATPDTQPARTALPRKPASAGQASARSKQEQPAAAAVPEQHTSKREQKQPAAPLGTSPAKRKARPAQSAAATGEAAPAQPAGSPSKKAKMERSSSRGQPGDAQSAPLAAGTPAAAARPAARKSGAAAPASGSGRRAGPASSPAAPRSSAPSGASTAGLQPAALSCLLQPAALRQQAAATTVVQAQALGEQQSLTDDALWALDGLSSGNTSTARDSLAALAEICAGRRGRLALRSSGLAADVLAAAGALKVAEDAVQALGLATLLLCFCQADADAGLLGRAEVAAAAAQLLQLSGALEVAPSDGAAAAKLLALLRERPYSVQVQAEERGCPLALALVALAGVLDPHDSPIDSEPFKRALRQAGALAAAAQVAAAHAGALSEPSPTIRTVRHLWRLHKALLVLENACFACPSNEAQLLAMEVRTGLPPLVATTSLVGWLVQQLALLARQALIAGIKKDCLRALLAVAMNLTQGNAAGCTAVAAAGALEAVAAVLAQLVRGGPKIRGVVAAPEELAVWADELSFCLMLLTNLVEHDPPRRRQLRALALPGGGTTPAGAAVVPLLCALMAAVAPRARAEAAAGAPTAAAAASGGGGLARRASLGAGGAGEVTVDALERGDAGGHASIAEAYAAILLGFLIQDSAAARGEAAALLGGSLQSVAAAVQSCLHFYVTTGAMTKGGEESLRLLLASLQQPPEATSGLGGTSDEDGAPSPVLG